MNITVSLLILLVLIFDFLNGLHDAASLDNRQFFNLKLHR